MEIFESHKVMDRNQEAIEAARVTQSAVNDAVDAIVLKATHLASLLVLLAHMSGSEDLPAQHVETVCWLGSQLADEIRTAAKTLG